MAVFPVIITNTPPPSVTITLANYTYQQFKNSLGTFVYMIDKMYLYSANEAQVSQVMLFMMYDSNGNQSFVNLTPLNSPWSHNNSIVLDTKKYNMVVDGRDALSFTILPNTTLIMQLFTRRITAPEYLDKYSKNNYQKIETAFGAQGLFENYTEELLS